MGLRADVKDLFTISMIPRERQAEIMKLINRNGTVKTSDLALRLDCTEETIRRDLDSLERANQVVRSHGGAMSIKDSLQDLQHHKRETREVKEKLQIGKKAASLVQKGETIFIDESSTALAMVDHLPTDFEINVVTTSLLVANRVSAHTNTRLYILGGLYDGKSFSFGGFLTEEAIRFMNIDRFFFSCKGIDSVMGGSEANEERARLKKNLLKFAKWRCLLADHTKLGLKAKFSFVFPNEIDLLITDSGADSESLMAYTQAGISTDLK